MLVRDPELRRQIREEAYEQSQVTDASLLLVMTVDLRAWAKDPKQYWQDAPAEVNELLSGGLGPFYEGDEQKQRHEAMRSIGIAGPTIMLAAKAMDYDFVR